MTFFSSIFIKLKFLDDRPKSEYENMTTLPGINAQKVLKKKLKNPCSTSFLPSFLEFRKIIPKHLKHKFTKEMSEKSEVVS